jgi:hypothetical protein
MCFFCSRQVSVCCSNQKFELLRVYHRDQCVNVHSSHTLRRLTNHVAVSPGALLYYDYFLTFTEEVVHFWSPLQCNWGTVIFLLNRYIAVFGHIPVVAQLFIPDSIKTTCSTLQLYHNCVTIVVQVIAASMKTYFCVYFLLTCSFSCSCHDFTGPCIMEQKQSDPHVHASNSEHRDRFWNCEQ